MPDVVTYLGQLTERARAATDALRDLASASDASPATREATSGPTTAYGISDGTGGGPQITGKRTLNFSAATLVAEINRLRGPK